MVCSGVKNFEESSSNQFVYEAHLLRLPKDFNGKFSHQMALDVLWEAKTSQKEAEEKKKLAEAIILDLPNLTTKQLLHLKKGIKNAQISALQSWIATELDDENDDKTSAGNDSIVKFYYTNH
ncbi:hypothetical protein LSH36_442g00043 [Paralvinella palmiformis]|uniref:Uncharacterized protein n=1 Tax=Paralvinella palmiformis TaxID=53620 RepID=A0AAD9JBR6_9ANNE|nr:hypothetical protein LSH36_442g00043 [Paralvinella palmiformis]